MIYLNILVFLKETISARISLIVLKYNTINKSFGKTHQESTNIGPSQLVYNGELKGITKGMEYTSSKAKPGQHFHIYSDNKAAIYRLQNPSDKPGQSYQIRAYKAAKLTKDQGAKISVEWILGHTDIPGNKLADLLAKKATKLPPESMEISYTVLGSKIKEARTKEWQEVLTKHDLLPKNPGSYKCKFP